MDFTKYLPRITVSVQKIDLTVSTALLMKDSPFWRKHLSAHARKYCDLLADMAADVAADSWPFDVSRVPPFDLCGTSKGLTVQPGDFLVYIDFLKDEAAAPLDASILDFWEPLALPVARMGNTIAYLAHLFGRDKLSLDIQNALAQITQQQKAARSGDGPDYEQVYEQQRPQDQTTGVLAEVQAQREKNRLAREAREQSGQKYTEEERDIWSYDGPGDARDCHSEEDDASAVLPSVLSPLPSHFYYSTSSRASTVARVYKLTHPLPVLEPSFEPSMPFMGLPIAVSLAPSSRSGISPQPAANRTVDLKQGQLARSLPTRFPTHTGANSQPHAATENPISPSAESIARRDPDSLPTLGRTGRRPLPTSPRRAGAYRRWNPYGVFDPLAGLRYRLRSRQARPPWLGVEHTEHTERGPLSSSRPHHLQSPEAGAIPRRQGQSEGLDEGE